MKPLGNKIDIHIGDRMIDVLSLLGNPNKDYRHKDTTMIFLNYLSLGIDLGFSNGGESLERIVLHTNHLSDSYFSFYDRCYFEIDTRLGKVTSVSRFSTVKEIIDNMMSYLDSKHLVKNPSSGARKTHVYQYAGLVVEVLPETDLISSLTLF